MGYTVVRQKRKTVAIVIDEHFNVIVKAPNYVTKKQIETLIQKNEIWILNTIEKKRKLIYSIFIVIF